MQIKEYLEANGLTKTSGSIDDAIKLLNERQRIVTTEQQTTPRDANTVAKEQQVLALLTGVLGEEPALPLTKVVTDQVIATLDGIATSTETTVEQKLSALRAGSLLLALKVELGNDLTYPYFGIAEVTQDVEVTTLGDSVAEENGFTDYILATDKKAYIRGLY